MNNKLGRALLLPAAELVVQRPGRRAAGAWRHSIVFVLTRRSCFGPDGISLRGALEAGGH